MKTINYPDSGELYQLAGTPEKMPARDWGEGNNEILMKNGYRHNAGYSCIFNWTANRYDFVSPSVKNILGYNRDFFLKNKHKVLSGIVHPDDVQNLKTIQETILNYLRNTALADRARLRFSYNYRIKRIDNTYLDVLLQSYFGNFNAAGKPTMEYINNIDITGFRNNNNNTLTIHRLSENGIYKLCYEQEFAEKQLQLSDREAEVMELIKKGYTTKEIAIKLCLSPETIKSHRKNIIAKLDTDNMAEAVDKINRKNNNLTDKILAIVAFVFGALSLPATSCLTGQLFV